MGRAKQYERTELLDRAVELFRRQGFNGTSTTELVEELGVNRKSMYSEFESKQGLFEATLEHYDRNHLSRVLGPLEADDAGLESIRGAFEDYASASEGRFSGLGCLMCNTAVERGATDPASSRFTAAYLARIDAAFRHGLGNAQQSGEIGEQANLGELAAFLTSVFVGVAASIRAEAPPEQLHATSKMVSDLLQTHSSPRT